MRRTFSARGPFGPWPTSNSTLSPSRRSSSLSPKTALWWKKYSLPPSPLMNPNPLSVRNVRIFPVIITPRRSWIFARLNLLEWQRPERAAPPFLRAAPPQSRATCDCSRYRCGSSLIASAACSAVPYRGTAGSMERLSVRFPSMKHTRFLALVGHYLLDNTDGGNTRHPRHVQISRG